MRAVVTLDLVRLEAVKQGKHGVAIEASKLELDCVLFCRLFGCEYAQAPTRTIR